VVIEPGANFEVFTDEPYTAERYAVAASPSPAVTSSPATISVQTKVAGADVELDGKFVGNTPATLQVAAGAHTVVVRQGDRSWQRTVQVTAGSEVNLLPVFAVRVVVPSSLLVILK
jgi:hypothetical protein